MIIKEDFILNRLVIKDDYGNIIDYNWVRIEEMLSRSALDISPAEYATLTQLLIGATEAWQLQEFLRLLTRPTSTSYEGEGIPIREFNREIILRLEANMLVSLLENIFTYGDLSERNHMKQLVSLLGFMASTPHSFEGELFNADFLNLQRNDTGGLVLSFRQFGERAWEPWNLPAHLFVDSLWKGREITFSEVLTGANGAVGLRIRDIIGEEAAGQHGVEYQTYF